MFIFPVFDQIKDRPNRWSLQIVDTGEFIQYPKVKENRFVHWTDKETPEFRDVFSMQEYADAPVDFFTVRTQQIGFLTTLHREFYEDGKYVEVWNDPVNYILADPVDYAEAYDHAEKRIGNYRMGVRRHITHLGGTLSDDELDMLEDNTGTALTSFPLFPPLPPTDFVKPFRTHLLSSDIGYIDYIKTAHPDEAAADKYAYQAKQSTGFRHFIFDAGNTNMKYEAATINSVSKVDIEDLETVVDVGIAAAVGAGALPGQTFLPRTPQDDGTWTLVNVPGQHMIKSAPDGLRLQMYDAGFATFISEIMLDQATGDIILTAGNTTIQVYADDSKIDIDTTAGNVPINILSGSGKITMTTTGDIQMDAANVILNGTVDVNGDMTVSGTTTHGG